MIVENFEQYRVQINKSVTVLKELNNTRKRGIIKPCEECRELMWSKTLKKRFCGACRAYRDKESIRRYHQSEKGQKALKAAYRRLVEKRENIKNKV